MASMRACASGLRRNATSCMPGQPDIADVLAAAAHEAIVFLAQEARAGPPHAHPGSRHLGKPDLRSRPK